MNNRMGKNPFETKPARKMPPIDPQSHRGAHEPRELGASVAKAEILRADHVSTGPKTESRDRSLHLTENLKGALVFVEGGAFWCVNTIWKTLHKMTGRKRPHAESPEEEIW